MAKPLPPVLASYLPAINVATMFKKYDSRLSEQGGFWLPFKLADIETPSDIKSIHISISRQTNSHSLLATKQGILPGSGATSSEAEEYKRFTRGVMVLEFNPSEYASVLDNNSASKWVYDPVTKECKIFIPFNFPAGTVGSYHYSQPSKENFQIGEAKYNTYYKVQIRFSGLNPPPADNNGESDPYNPEYFVHKARPAVGQRLANHLTNETNLDYFSEWSSIGLVRLVAPREFKNSIFGPDQTEVSYGSSMITVAGMYVPTNIDYMHPSEKTETVNNQTTSNPYYYLGNGATNDEEYLMSYQVKVYEKENNDRTLVHTSEILRPIATNQVEYNVPLYLENSKSFEFEIDFTTGNMYNETITRDINVSYSTHSWSQQDIVDPPVEGLDSVIGKVSFPFNGAEIPGTPPTYKSIPVGTVFTIRRGEDTDNFGFWPLLYQKEVKEADTKYVIFDDFTIESGVIYKYELLMTLPANTPVGGGTLSEATTYKIDIGPLLSVFDHAFLTGEGKQLSVKFNPNVSSFKRNVSDNIVNTVGGKYPYVTRNSYMDYRSFSLSGTIAYEMDLERQFASRTSIYGEWFKVYGSYFVNHFMNPQNDRITQRKFRELVMDYLYSDQPKLFRSTPEGNILVRITDVTLTPNQALGRMIYDFSCTATEIGEATIPNCQLYKIQDFGDI